jgi:hypothetical protein
MGKLYIAGNGAEPTTASRVAVATGAAIKTLLQVATPTTTPITIVEWGISFDGSAAATPGIVELLQTDVAASGGTSLTPTLFDDPWAPPSLCIGGAALTCFSPTTEGSITTVRTFDMQQIAPTNQYIKQFPLGREPQVPISKFLRIRVKFPATVNAICYVIWVE